MRHGRAPGKLVPMSCTLTEYAAAKCLPVEFLTGLGLRDVRHFDAPAIEIPYAGAECVRIRLRIEKTPDGDGRFQWKAGSAPTFYGLDRLEQPRKAGHVVLVEGESDAQTLWFAGVPSIGVPGASMLDAALRRAPQTFDGIAVVYVIDERDGGAKGLLDSLRKSAIADRVGVVDLAPNKDPSALWCALAKGVPVDQARAEMEAEMAMAMSNAVPLVGPKEVAQMEDNGSPAAIAATLAAGKLPMQVRWMAGAVKSWTMWDDRRWAVCGDAVPVPLQVAIRHAVADGIAARKIDSKSVNQLESANGMRGIGLLASAYPQLQISPYEVDPVGLVAFASHVLDVKTGTALPHDPARLITRCTPVDPGPSCALWEIIDSHLRTCLGDGYTAVHRYLGSCLMGRGADRKLLWLHGPGGDGKSTLAKVLRYALGDYAAVVPAEVFGVEGGRGAHLSELASGMNGARLAIALEVGKRLDWPKLKGLSGGDEQVSKRLHGRSYSVRRPPLLMLISNDRPEGLDQASAERVILAELQPPVETDERLMQVMADGGAARDEVAAACLGWLVQGAAEFNAEGLGPVATMAHVPSGLALWWRESVAAGEIEAKRGWVTLEEIRGRLDAWTERGGHEPVGDKDLSFFLLTVVLRKRFKDARRYNLALRVTGGDG